MTPEKDVAHAMNMELKVPENQWEVYMEFMNYLPMKDRYTDPDIRDGCILSGLFWNTIRSQNN